MSLMAVAMFATAQAASARYVTQSDTDTIVEVCAQSLTQHLYLGGTVTLHYGHDFYVTSIGEGGSTVWGYNEGSRYGWVYNGWFC
jgi:hypothetical protein